MSVNGSLPARGDDRSERSSARFGVILAAAAELFRDRGFEGTSVQDIAERVGMRRGNLYNYVASKEELLLVLVEAPADALLAEVERLGSSADPVDSLWRQLVELQVKIFSEHYPAPFIYLSLTREQRREHFPHWDTYYLQHLMAIVRRGRDGGDYREGIDVEFAARAIMSILAWMSAWYEPRGTANDEQIIDEFSSFIESALRS